MGIQGRGLMRGEQGMSVTSYHLTPSRKSTCGTTYIFTCPLLIILQPTWKIRIFMSPIDVFNSKQVSLKAIKKEHSFKILTVSGHELLARDWNYMVNNILKDQAPGILERCEDIIRSSLNALELNENDKRGSAMFAVRIIF
jgi:hypothetical protein